MMRDKGIRLLESFLCAGTSALLISVAHLYPEYWFVSLFALIPFLWRVVGRVPSPLQADKKPDNGVATFINRGCRVTRPIRLQQVGRVLTHCKRGKTRHVTTSAVILGMMLATCYALVAYPTELWTIPGAFLLKLFALNLIFCVYAITVNRLKRHIGFNVIFIAALWLPLEYTLSHYAGLENLFTLSPGKTGLPVLLRIGSLFGLLMISFIVVLINSLILIILRQIAQALLSCGALSIPDDKRPYPPFKEIILERRWYYFPDVRAPPLSNGTTCRSKALRF
jgi:hypothetical protein